MLFFLVVRLSRLSVRGPRWLSLGAALALAAIGVSEQLPRLDSPEELRQIARMVEADEQFGRELEAKLPDGAMIFQLPVLGFPEVATPYQLNDYEHFRPFLATQDLRFSYGAPKTRARSRWQRDLANAPAAELVTRLERYGFAALYINRKGFADRAESLLNELERRGYGERIETAGGNQIAVMLRPAADPRLPMARSLTIGRGWHIRPDAGVRWAYGEGALSYFNPYSHPIHVDLQLTLQAVTPREVILARNGDRVRSISVDTAPTTLDLARFEMLPGINRFTLRSDSPATRLGQGPNQLRSFGLKASSVRRSAAGDAQLDPAIMSKHD